jgi:hypothetical protein
VYTHAEIKINNYSELWRLADSLKKVESSGNPDTFIIIKRCYKTKKYIVHGIVKHKCIYKQDTLIGLFQFSKAVMTDLNLKNEFANFTYQKSKIFNSTAQYIAFARLAILNLYYLRAYKKYIGHSIHKIKITKSGLIAASLLGGAKGVKNFINHGADASDMNGTRISQYLKRFQNYKL